MQTRVSGGVGPIGKDIGLPHDQEPQESGEKTTNSGKRFLNFRQLYCLSVMTVLSASGMVSLEDFLFVIFSLFYLYFLSKFAFPRLNSSPQARVFSKNNRLFRFYFRVSIFVGFIFPILYILEGIFEGDKEGIKAAASHVFLLSGQGILEGIAFSDRFSLPISVFVPVFYNAKRFFTTFEWLKSEIRKADEEFGSGRRLYIGRGLAIANLGFWSFNLFGVLLPVYMPLAFKKYYEAKD